MDKMGKIAKKKGVKKLGRKPGLPYKKKEVMEFLEQSMGSITSAANIVGVPFSTFYNWMEKYDLKEYTEVVKRKLAFTVLDRMKYLALTPQSKLDKTNDKASEKILVDMMKKWGHLIGYEEPKEDDEENNDFTLELVIDS